MSLEDLDSDFLSDESDYEAEKNLSEGEKDDDDVSNYLELVYLHNNLMCFQHIHNNNAIIDMQCMGSEAGPSFDSVGSELALIRDHLNSLGSELVFLQDHMNSVLEHVFSTSSSSPSSVTSHGDGSSPNSVDSALSRFQDFVQQYEEVTSTSSSSSSDTADVVDGQMTDADDTNYLQDGDAEGQL